MSNLISETYKSNLFTMMKACGVDSRQAPMELPTVPSSDVCVLRARLLLEECVETIRAMGCDVVVGGGAGRYLLTRELHIVGHDASLPPIQLCDIIDGCCDTIYVAVGTLAACGVPDTPHLDLVCRKNDAKFVGAPIVVDGKFQKPEGWTPPNHRLLVDAFAGCLSREMDKVT